MRAIAVGMLISCAAKPPPTPIANTSGRTVVDAALPCGAAMLDELSPFDAARCAPDRTCTAGPPRRIVGSCRVAASSSFDMFGGRSRLTVFEGERRIVSSDAPPNARMVVFDPRLPTRDGVRVGMTGADLERFVPRYTELACRLDDPAWRGYVLCSLRESTHLDCDNPDAEGILVVFSADGVASRGNALVGVAARAFVRARPVVAVDLGPACGGD